MIQVLLCGELALENGNVKESLRSCAASCEVELAEVIESASAIEAVDRIVHPGQKPLVDIVVTDSDLPGLSGLEMLREVKDAGQPVHSILLASPSDSAFEALNDGVGGFLVKPVGKDDFERVLARVLTDVKRRRSKSVEIRFRDQARRIDLLNIVYAETVDHDQVIHLVDGRNHAVRCSSSVLFEQLSHDPCFFKAGSSNIVNLMHVRSVTTRGIVELSNGVSVTVPMRLRKSLEDTLIAFGL